MHWFPFSFLLITPYSLFFLGQVPSHSYVEEGMQQKCGRVTKQGHCCTRALAGTGSTSPTFLLSPPSLACANIRSLISGLCRILSPWLLYYTGPFPSTPPPGYCLSLPLSFALKSRSWDGKFVFSFTLVAVFYIMKERCGKHFNCYLIAVISARLGSIKIGLVYLPPLA